MSQAKFKELETKFYKLLKKRGFKDIENPSFKDGPLKDSWRQSDPQLKRKIEIREEYQKIVDAFTNSKDFNEICLKMTSHGNCKLGLNQIKEVWDLNTQQGWTERSLAKQFKVSISCIHFLLERFRKWMDLN
jgi:hypothetical protein